MCGIAGMADLNPRVRLTEDDRATVRAMCDSMAYRGPDGSGTALLGSACLGHRRLSIIDLSGGAQPMSDASGRLSIVFNGEIYNFQELRRELTELGARFQTNSDTEVILEAYRRWDLDCLDRLDGMFAFALWDRDKKCLFGARDRFGKKPFFYTIQKNRFYFASELSALKKVPGLSFTLDPLALSRFLAYQYVPCPGTMFREVRQLEPARFFLVEENCMQVVPYWDLPEPSTLRVSEEEACEELGRLLRRAVRARMISDVPLGVFLSGGIDSSIVTGLMAEISSRSVRSFSIGFREASYDESGYARTVARAFGTDHHERILSADDCTDILPAVVQAMDVPMADASVAPTWLLSRTTREKVTVALGGDGSDELWAGYEHYIGFAVAETYSRLPGFLRKGFFEPVCRRLPASAGYVNPRLATETFFRAAAQPPWLRIQSMLTACSPEMQREILAQTERLPDPEVLYEPTRNDWCHWYKASPFDRNFFSYSRGFLLDDILTKVDRCSMLNSLEVRAPFLDRAVAEFTLRLPSRFKLKGFQRKYILKKTFSKLLPPEILHRNKRGFQIPVAHWLRGRMRPLMEDLLSGPSLTAQGIFDPAALRRLMDAHIRGDRDLRVPLWTLMVFQLWWRGAASSASSPA